MKYRYSDHAVSEMEKRNIRREMVDAVLDQPMQRFEEYNDVICLQSQVNMNGSLYLLRVMVNEGKNPPVVVTVYRTSKISKYWRLS